VRPAGLIATFAAMGVATYLTRAPLLLVLARRQLPGWLERYFAALPIALLTALALPLVLLPSGQVVAPGRPRCLAPSSSPSWRGGPATRSPRAGQRRGGRSPPQRRPRPLPPGSEDGGQDGDEDGREDEVEPEAAWVQDPAPQERTGQAAGVEAR
jgi:hypothetical protein